MDLIGRVYQVTPVRKTASSIGTFDENAEHETSRNTSEKFKTDIQSIRLQHPSSKNKGFSFDITA